MDFLTELQERLKRIAREDKKNYPQYKGFFDNWILAESTTKRVLEYKGGSRLARGRWVLANPSLTSWFDPDNGTICAVDNGTLTKV